MSRSTARAADGSSLDAWRRRLRPWLRALSDHLVINVPLLPSRGDMCAMWITVDASDATVFDPQPWTVFMEALELLDLLVRVDPEVGWDIVLETACVNRAFVINQAALFPRQELRPRYRILAEDIRQHVVPVFIALSRLVDGAQRVGAARETTAFQRTKRLLLDQWRSQHAGKAFDRETAGRIEVKLSLVLVAEFTSDVSRFIIHRTREVAIASRPNSRPSSLVCAVENISNSAMVLRPANGRPFHLGAVDFALVDDDLTNELTYVLLDIHDRGLPISELEIDQLIAANLHAAIANKFFTTILKPTQSPSLASTSGGHGVTTGGIERLIITSGVFDDDAVEAICSGIAVSQSLREVEFSNAGVRNQAGGQPLWWPWMAFALFGSTACHTIQYVSLDLRGFTTSDVEAMRRVLSASNPLTYLCALDEDESTRPPVNTRPMAAIFKEGEFMEMSRRWILRRADDATRGFFSSASTFEITRDIDGEEYVEFLFPGTGVCWTPRVNIVRQFELAPCGRISPISHLKLEFDGASQNAVVELLELVGASVKRLTLAVGGCEILDNAVIDAVCKACPKLSRLDIDGDVECLCWLVSPTDDDQARCQLESFSVYGRVIDTSSFLTLFQKLSDRNHSLTRSLQEFSYKKRAMTQDTPLDEISAHWLQMLSSNSTLRRSEIDISADEDDEAAETLAARFRPHDGTRIFMREAIAFLSVMTRNTKLAATKSSIPHLNTDILTMIMALANIPAKRICG